MLKHFRLLLFGIYIILGGYFIFFSYNKDIIPEIIFDFNSLIFFIGGVFLILGGINYFRVRRGKKREVEGSVL